MKANLISTITVLGLVSMVPIGAVQAEEANSDEVIEEQVVLGKFLGSAQALLLERQEDEAIVDTLDSDSISRMGDSTVAAALRRVTGLSLIDNKFIYVRGLGSGILQQPSTEPSFRHRTYLATLCHWTCFHLPWLTA